MRIYPRRDHRQLASVTLAANHLSRKANQKDFQDRMRQFFDHHLKGVEAPEWMKKGVPFLEKGKKAPAKVVS